MAGIRFAKEAYTWWSSDSVGRRGISFKKRGNTGNQSVSRGGVRTRCRGGDSTGGALQHNFLAGGREGAGFYGRAIFAASGGKGMIRGGKEGGGMERRSIWSEELDILYLLKRAGG